LKSNDKQKVIYLVRERSRVQSSLAAPSNHLNFYGLIPSLLSQSIELLFWGSMGEASALISPSLDRAHLVAPSTHVRFFNLVDLVNQLEQEKAAGRGGRLCEKLLRYDLIVID